MFGRAGSRFYRAFNRAGARTGSTSRSFSTKLNGAKFASVAMKGGFVVATSAIAATMLWNQYETSNESTAYAETKADVVLPALPYAKNALAPFISEETLNFHYEKHHRGYVTKLNGLLAGTQQQGKSVEILLQEEKSGKIFNLAAQIYNHTFYWNSMKPNGGGRPTGKLAEAIDSSFGSFENFQKQFNEAAVNHFGSGWAWLVQNPTTKKLEIVQTHDAGCPLTEGKIPLLTCDVWEHAYYIDYRNDRVSYVNNWWKVVNYEFAAAQMK